MVPKVGGVLAQWREETFVRDQERIERMSQGAAEAIDLGDLLEAMQEDERVSDMFRVAVDAAVRTGAEDKLHLLGRALAAGALAADDAAVDEAEQLLRTAVELDPVDLRALLVIEDTQSRHPRQILEEHLEISTAVALAVMARLQRLGLVAEEQNATLNDARDKTNEFVDIDQTYVLTALWDAMQAVLADQGR
jgi:hypothetical protein